MSPALHSTFRFRVSLCVCILLSALLLASAGADDTGEKGRAVFAQYKDTVVTVRAVVGVSFGDAERESEQEANATLLDADGLAVLALSAIDPMQIAGGYRSTDDMTTRIISLRIILPDGSEKPAETILRDKELDLALIRLTEKPETPLPHVSLDNIGKPQVLDEVLCIMQYGRIARRTHAAFIDRIEMVVERPRLFYSLGDYRARQLVCSPVFTLDGAFVGVGVVRMIAGDADSMPEDMMVIIVPGEQLQALLAQVPPRE